VRSTQEHRLGEALLNQKCAEMGTGEFEKQSTRCSCGELSGLPAAEENGFARPNGQAKNRRKHGRFRLIPTEDSQK
jgi:hypothetical protein